jgi:glycerol kinase
MTKRYVMALDEGSTSARTVLVNEAGKIVSEAREPVVPLLYEERVLCSTCLVTCFRFRKEAGLVLRLAPAEPAVARRIVSPS